MKKKLLFVFNPKSGKGLIKEHLVNIVDIMTKAGYKITIYPTQCQGDAIKKVRKNAEKYDLVVCSGGDGTLDELEMDVCPACGSKNLTKIDRMNGYLSYSRVKGDTRLNESKMAEIAERVSM